MYHTQPKLHTSQTLPFHNNLPYPPPYFGYPDMRVLPCVSINTTPPWIPTYPYPSKVKYLPYPTNRRKNIPPYIVYLPHLPHLRHLSVHTCTHLTIPFITYPNLHFPTLYYCQGLIKYKAETIYQIRPELPRTETTQAEMTQAEMTQGRNDSGLKQTT